MLSLDDAWDHVRARLPRLPVADVPLAAATGLVLAEDVNATAAVPPFANSAVDGYAVRRRDVDGAPDGGDGLELDVVAEAAAGHVVDTEVGPGQAVRIMTGAAVPPGADAVVMVEDTERVAAASGGRERVRLLRAGAAGDHVRPAGDDLRPGALVAPAGTLLTPAHVGLLSTVGRSSVAVVRRPVVGVVSTGDELVGVGTALGPGQIYDSNRPQLLAAVADAGFVAVDLGHVQDDEAEVESVLFEGASRCDAVLTSGGVSMGDHDLVKVVLDRVGDMRWMQVAIKPAKPFAFGLLPGPAGPVPVFGLPGNPVSSLVSFELFARPGVRTMMGHPHPGRRRVAATAGTDLHRRPDGKTHFVRVVVEEGADGRLTVVPTTAQGSHQLTGLAAAQGLAVLPDGTGAASGDAVRVLLLD
ncbi:MAG: gephyrin-like molybdotransferase Glp [Actinomycetes bacterium]